MYDFWNSKLKKVAQSLFLLSILLARPCEASGPPAIIIAPVLNQTVLFKGTAIFTVVASSGTTMSFQWYKDGVPISGATSSTLTVSDCRDADQGTYTVNITNGGGVVSSSGTLTVLGPPAITTQPVSLMVTQGQTATFSAQATGTSVKYQWNLNGAAVAGATKAALTITNVQMANAGSYTLLVTNDYGSDTSAPATLVLQALTGKYNGSANDNDYLQAMAVDPQGNVYVTGYAKESTNGSSYDFVTIKYDSVSNLVWRVLYDGGSGKDDQAVALAVDNAGNVYVTGSSKLSGGEGGWDFVTVKYNSDGKQIWAKRFNGAAGRDDFASAIALDNNGNVFVTGQSQNNASIYQYATLKYDSAGNQLWVRTYAGPAASEDDPSALAVDSLGNAYVTGSSKGSGSDFDYATIKYTSDGTQSWVARYNGPTNSVDKAVKVAVDANQNVYVTGSSMGSGSGYDYATLKYSSTGSQLWEARYNGPANKNDMATSMVVDGWGNVIVTGSSEVTAGHSDYATVKYSAAGAQLWAQRYDGPAQDDDDANAVALDPAGDIYVTGASKASGTGYDFATLKYRSADGAQIWVARFNSGSTNSDTAVALAIDNQYNIYVGGQAFNKLDYTILKYQFGLVAPAIISQPQNTGTMRGQNASFLVTASGTGPMRYQWRFNGNPIAGGSGSSLALSNVQPAYAGSYSVVITNTSGSVTSTVAMLSVSEPPIITSTLGNAGMTPDGFSFQLSVPAGFTYIVLASTNLQNWTPIATNISQNAALIFTDTQAANYPSRFYRAVILQ